MSLMKHDATTRETTQRRLDLFDRFLDDWPEMFRRPLLLWPDRGAEPPRVEEFTEDGQLVIRVELPGVDPGEDVEVTVDAGMLRISGERRAEERHEGRDYLRRELRYGAFRRELPLPRDVSEEDVRASYQDGILEVRVTMPKAATENGSRRIPVTKA